MLLGGITNSLDAKARISVPADIRANIVNKSEINEDNINSFQGIIVWPSVRGPFLEGGGEDLIRSYKRSLDMMDPYDEARMILQYSILGASRRLSCDKGGRVSLPKEFIEYAQLTDSATFVGLGDSFEIWNPQAFQELTAPMRDKARLNLHHLKSNFNPAGQTV